MRTIVIVQARFASTRLPGKVMLSLGGTTVLREVLLRCAEIEGVAGVCCAISDGFGADILAAEAEASGADVCIASDDDVLERYLAAARQTKADVILRVTSDCPLIDPAVCAAVLAERERLVADYCANNLVSTFPHGLDCEAFTRDALERAASLTQAAYDREHVTPCLRREPGFTRCGIQSDETRYARFRWTLDYPEDYRFLHAVFRQFGRTRLPWRELAQSLDRTDLPSINAARAIHHENDPGSAHPGKKQELAP